MGELQKGYVKEGYPNSVTTSKIIAAAQEVYQALGPGYREIIYQRALAIELPAHRLEFAREEWMDVYYKDHKIGRKRWTSTSRTSWLKSKPKR